MMDKYQLINKIICDIDGLQLSGYKNFALAADALEWLLKLRDGLKEEDEKNGHNPDKAENV